MADEVRRWVKGDKVKINAPKETIHGRVATVDNYAVNDKIIYVETQTGERVWVYPFELTLHKDNK